MSMPKIPALKPKDAIHILEKADFYFLRQKGSHRLYAKGKISITVPFHNKDLKRGTLRYIIKQAGLTIEQFIKLSKN